MISELTENECLAISGGKRDELTAKAVKLVGWALGYTAMLAYGYALLRYYTLKTDFAGRKKHSGK